MPVIPEIKVDTAPKCNLRQALQWISDGIAPVDIAFEPALGRQTAINLLKLERERSALFAAVLSGAVRLFGRPGRGRLYFDQEDISFAAHDDPERIEIAKLREAGIDGLDFVTSRLWCVTEYVDTYSGREATAGWEYTGCFVLTAELQKTFRDDLEDPFAPPPAPIVLTASAAPLFRESTTVNLPPPLLLFLNRAIEYVANRTGATWSAAAEALHGALCAWILTGVDAAGHNVPESCWRSYTAEWFANLARDGRVFGGDDGYVNPHITWQSVDAWLDFFELPAQHQTAQLTPARRSDEGRQISDIEPTRLPPYLAFAVNVFEALGASTGAIDARKKDEIENLLRQRWSEAELGQASDKMIGAIATMLRSPAAKSGGAKPARREGGTVSAATLQCLRA